jgi:hypothetical protein
MRTNERSEKTSSSTAVSMELSKHWLLYEEEVFII